MTKFRVLTGCRSCGGGLRKVLDLGDTPIANNLCASRAEAIDAPRYPLVLMRCEQWDCGLYQLSVAVDADVLYGDYTYATPTNPELEAHYQRAVDWIRAGVVAHDRRDQVVEIGSNNGIFLTALSSIYSMGNLVGVDPSPVRHNDEGIARIFAPFNVASLRKDACGRPDRADLVVARHCLAHVDDVHAVLEAVDAVLARTGSFYIENAYWFDSMLGGQFDQVYHEHMSYLTIEAVEKLLRRHNMTIVDVNFSDVHGGSFMLLAGRPQRQPTVNVPVAIRAERAWLFQGLEERFVKLACSEISKTYSTIMSEFSQGHVVDAYGAAAKAVTRFSAAKITHEHVRQCVDDSPLKQGKFLPGSGIPIVSRDDWISRTSPDAVYLTAWNYERSLRQREAEYLAMGGRFIR